MKRRRKPKDRLTIEAEEMKRCREMRGYLPGTTSRRAYATKRLQVLAAVRAREALEAAGVLPREGDA